MRVILTGSDAEVGKVIKENSLRVNRGLVSFECVDETAKKGRKKADPEIEGKPALETESKGLKE